MTDTLRPTVSGAAHPLRPRRVSFDYGATPTHWVPGDPHTTHVINVLHLLLPAGGGYVRRWATMVVIVTGLVGLWVLGTRFLLRRDATITTGRWPSPKRFRRTARQRRLPRLGEIALAVPRYLAPRCHPSHEGRTEIAIGYLATAPA